MDIIVNQPPHSPRRHMKVFALLPLLLLFTCNSAPAPAPKTSSASATEFIVDLGPADNELSQNDGFERNCDNCKIAGAPADINGRKALKISTESEFSDFFIDLENTFGYPIDFTKAKYLTLRIMVPEGSYIKAMKLNFKDAAGNFGGVGEVANNFPGNYGEWQTVLIDLEEALQDFRLWHGDNSPLPAVTQLSLNPYNANHEGDQSYYVNLIQVSNEKPAYDFDEPLLPHPNIPNQTYTFTFDDQENMDALMAYRVFEASNQAFATGIGGNETNAIRLRGRDFLNNIAFLPILKDMNGQSVDFTRLEEIFFDYYLEPGGDEFDGATVWITSDGWNNILMDGSAYNGFEAGKWETVTLPLADLKLESVKGEADFLTAVDEWRLNLNFREGKKDITMWLDNVGWR